MLRAALLLLALTFAGSTLAQGEPPKQGEQGQAPTAQTQKSSTTNQQTADPQSIVVNIQPPQKTEAERSEEARERHEKADLDRQLVKFTAGLYYATIALAIATVVLVMVTGLLVRFAAVQARDMKDSIAVANKAASAAEKSSKVAEDALLGLEAPYLFLEIFEVGIFIERAGKSTRIQEDGSLDFGLLNHGRTPAVLKRTYFIGALSDGNLPPPLDPLKIAGDITHGGMVVAAGKRSRDFSHSHRQQFASDPSKTLYFYGFIVYSDVFGNEITSGFCFIFEPILAQYFVAGGNEYNYRRQKQFSETGN